MNPLPSTMKALQIDSYKDALSFNYIDKTTPKPSKNQVLIRIRKAAVNPSDLAFVTGNYGFSKPLPVVPGMEGCGEVVATGDHSSAASLLGKRVACIAGDGDGTWAEYMLAESHQCIPLEDDVPDQYAAMLMVNPMTALALMDHAEQKGHKTLILNAASSALSRMIRLLAQETGIRVINIVRQRRQAKDMSKSGIEFVLNSSSQDFTTLLSEMCQQLNASLLLDAVAGESTGQILSCMPEASEAVIYGGLSGKGPSLNIGHLIFQDHIIRGFWLAHYLKKTAPEKLIKLSQRAQWLMQQDLDIRIQSEPPLKYAAHRIASYAANMSKGKVLITPAEHEAI
ncbi:zinc-binding dehydrogenase [Bermanella marisrubri]|uniref:NADH oxidoreductase n=1 Tax=Bermanella marisrubri TaxID=207949 RepID=Q1N3U8_9GAMM|nr:alcohol dehydrogenase catalytic domain-containing protein [Bermanella marisrubri]EAT12776.1 NADH oxidoreductase [Oceanobacter sp. RED65] [Bermanella marisrubri]QIZ83104.1 zinc-binding dehydrogenase [Bermanella marisrubri]